MPRFTDFHFDRLSFWLGFLAATLFWYFISRVRPMLPVWRKQALAYFELVKQKNLAGMESYMRQETLRRAQRMHLAAPIFALDEVLVQPRLIAPPPVQDPQESPFSQSLAGQFIPYLPEWPELTSALCLPAITAAQALQNGSHIAIIGQPGAGKTVALAHLASQLSRLENLGSLPENTVPLLVHALDLNPTLEENQDPLQNLIKTLNGYASVVMQPQIPRFINGIFRDRLRRNLLLLDGLDELAPEQLSSVLAYLNALIGRYANLQVVVTASSDYLDSLTSAGFYPLGVAGWKPTERESFVQRWGNLWTEQLAPEFQKQQGTPAEVDPLLLSHWLNGEKDYTSPLEMTLRVWAAYSGDLSGSSLMTLLDTHIARFMPSAALMPALEVLAVQMTQQMRASISFDAMEKILSGYQLNQPLTADQLEQQFDGALPASAPGEAVLAEHLTETPDSTTAETEGAEKRTSSKKKRRDLIVSQGEKIINALVEGGILVQHSGQQYRFASPVFLGYLAGIHISPEEAAVMVETLEWPVHTQALQYAAACGGDDVPWLYQLVENPNPPLCRGLLTAARWLREAPSNAEWRSYLMRAMVNLIQLESVPLGTRARLIGAFYLSRDPSAPRLFKQLLAARSPNVRRVALLGLGATGSQQAIGEIQGLLNDPDIAVRITACLALAAIPGDAALKTVVEILTTGEEAQRQVAAEALAQNEAEGHPILEEAAGIDDLLARRAAVFGLMQVRNPWARQTLERMAVEDAQWVVRNAAAQALETLQEANPYLPKSLPPPSEASWLITFASKIGLGVSPNQPATDILLMALKSGSIDEQIAALQYLREQPDEGVVAAVYNLLYGDQEDLHEPALHTLWWMSLSGKPMPAPTQYGLG
jgi:HEAT repeat protein